MPTSVNGAGGAKPATSVSRSTFIRNDPVPSLTVTKASVDCGVAGIVPEVIVVLAIDTNCPSNASGLPLSAAIVIGCGIGAGLVAITWMPYGDVVFSTDSV